MRITTDQISDFNSKLEKDHKDRFDFYSSQLSKRGIESQAIVDKLRAFQVAIPSWALGTGGTRFGRFPGGGEPRSLEEKLEDVGTLHALNQSSGAISLHIPWDIPADHSAIKELADQLNLMFDAVNSNTFQNQESQDYSYKFGSLSHVDEDVRRQAVEHNIDVIRHGDLLGSKALTVWLADGSCFPGQVNFRKSYENTLASLEAIYEELPPDWRLLLEYKPYEPNFYSMAIPDWGTSFSMVSLLGDKASTLVDLGHHLPNTNIEQIVAILQMKTKLGGFHFNDSKYGDDDLTVGSLKPYQLFLIFCELVQGSQDTDNPTPAWMIDASHNLKDPLEDLLQSTDAILTAHAQALIVDYKQLETARDNNDVTLAQQILQSAFRTDVRSLVSEAMKQSGGALLPLDFYRQQNVRSELIKSRGTKTISTGL